MTSSWNHTFHSIFAMGRDEASNNHHVDKDDIQPSISPKKQNLAATSKTRTATHKRGSPSWWTSRSSSSGGNHHRRYFKMMDDGFQHLLHHHHVDETTTSSTEFNTEDCCCAQSHGSSSAISPEEELPALVGCHQTVESCSSSGSCSDDNHSLEEKITPLGHREEDDQEEEEEIVFCQEEDPICHPIMDDEEEDDDACSITSDMIHTGDAYWDAILLSALTDIPRIEKQ